MDPFSTFTHNRLTFSPAGEVYHSQSIFHLLPSEDPAYRSLHSIRDHARGGRGVHGVRLVHDPQHVLLPQPSLRERLTRVTAELATLWPWHANHSTTHLKTASSARPGASARPDLTRVQASRRPGVHA